MDIVLKTEDLVRRFGGVIAVNKVNIEILKGEIYAVIGPNGAGKSTFFNLITNFISPSEGKVFFKGEDITNIDASTICKKGIARSFQLTNIYPKLTVFDSVQMSLLSHRGWANNIFRSTRSLLKEETEAIIEMVGLKESRDITGELLPHGDKKRLELAITLGNEPELLLMDEPTAGMSPDETWQTVELIDRLATEKGLTILFTEHDMDVVFDIADRIAVLYYGELIFKGTPEEVQRSQRVKECYLGESC
ncbi:MAG TPA: ABC transporter ATP-binding protein [Syntrophorhabdus sp.]|nr:ABC transporter ATP-binding protein [Syntrophorhabdus sp.]